jgi:hypothetical protein
VAAGPGLFGRTSVAVIVVENVPDLVLIVVTMVSKFVTGLFVAGTGCVCWDGVLSAVWIGGVFGETAVTV